MIAGVWGTDVVKIFCMIAAFLLWSQNTNDRLNDEEIALFWEQLMREAKPGAMASVGETEFVELNYSFRQEAIIRAVWINSFDPGFVITVISQDQPGYYEHRIYVKQIGVPQKVGGVEDTWETKTKDVYLNINEQQADEIETKFFNSELENLIFTPDGGDCTDGSRLWLDAANDEDQKIELTRHQCDEGFSETVVYLDYLIDLVAQKDAELGSALAGLRHK